MNTNILALIALAWFPLCGAAPLAGGFSTADPASPEVRQAAEFAVGRIAIESTEKGAASVSAKLTRVISARSQIVAGVNYELRLELEVDGKPRKARATVWWQAWNKEAPYRLTSWAWD